jgi:hypothetical protein
MPATRKWKGITNGLWDTADSFDTAPVGDDSVTFFGADLGAGNQCTAGPGAPLTLVAVTADAAYGEGTICYDNMTVGTVTGDGWQEITGGIVTNATLNGGGSVSGGTITTLTKGSVSGGTVTTATFGAGDRMTGGTVTTATFNAGDRSGLEALSGGTITTLMTWNASGEISTEGSITLSGCTVNVTTDMSVADAGFTTDAGTVLDFTVNPGKTISLYRLTWLGTFKATVAGTYAVMDADLIGAMDFASAVTITTAGACTLTLSGTGSTAGLSVLSDTTTLGANLSIDTLHVAAGATLDGGGFTLALANPRITGAGTITNCVFAAEYRAEEGIIDAGTNTNLVMHQGEYANGTACTTSTAT